MIIAEKVNVNNKLWIKVSFKYNPLYVENMKKIPGALYNQKSRLWAVPFERKDDFERIMGNFLIIWQGEEYNAGGIDENTIPPHPIIPGYKIVYNNNEITNVQGFKTKPWGEFQVKGFNILCERNFLILADDAGLGKSWQVLTAIEARKKLGHLQRGLIVCKASLLYNWRDEVYKHTNLKSVIVTGTPKQRSKLYSDLLFNNEWTVLIISYDTFRQDINILQTFDNSKGFDFCVLDEAHVCKNPQSKIGTYIHLIPFKYKYVLTATPLPNSPLEAYNYLKWGGIVNMNWWAFQNRYAIFGGYNNKEIIGYKNINEIRDLLQKHMLRRTKSDKLKELPPVVFKTIKVPMTKTQAQLYKAVKTEIIEELENTSIKSIPSALTKLLRLQQITDSVRLLGADFNTTEESAKLNALDELLEDLIDEGKNKVIIFSRFKTMVDILQQRYSRYNPAVIHGDINAEGISRKRAEKELQTKYKDFNNMSLQEKEKLLSEYTASERQRQVYKFQNDYNCKLFIGCAPACREGLTLTAASHVIFIDTEWSYDYVMQAYSRAHRIGQQNNVTVYFLVCEGTVDEYILNVVLTKKQINEYILGKSIIDETKALDAKEFIKRMVG